MVLEQLQSSLSSEIAKLSGELEAGSAGRKERAAVVAAAQSALDAAQAQQQAASEAMEAAKAQQSLAASAFQSAECKAAEFELQLGALMKVQEEKETALQNFEGYNVECFNTLRDKAAAAGA